MYLKKTLTLLLSLLLLCSFLSACGSADTPQTTGNETAATLPSDTAPVSTPPAETEPAEPDPLIPVDIETTGGLVIVGTIGMDEEGWYIRPEQPLNITYRYFLEKPSLFPDTTRIKMFDPKEDGVEKAFYIGQTVTTGGTLRFYRDDFETLYFSPYTITIGKNAEHSYRAPELMPPEEVQNRYDPTVPLPEAMTLTTEEGGYVFNLYMLSRETLEFMGNDFAEFYAGFVAAFLNYETEYPCPDDDHAQMLSSVIYYELPLFNACAEPFEYFRHYNRETGMLTIHYKHSKEGHDAVIAQFFSAANALLEGVTTAQTETEKAKTVYHNLCTKMTYDYSALEEFERKESYYAYLHNSGVCVTFANVYNQLLTRVGIDTGLAHCDNVDTIGHSWSIVTLDGQQYFCDPTFELSYDSGTGYRFFGMNYAKRIEDGTGTLGIRCGRYYTWSLDPETIAGDSLF